MRPNRRFLSFAAAFAAAACAPYQADTPDVSPQSQGPAPRVQRHVPVQPRQLGTAPADASAAQREALWWVNTYREHAGLGPVDQVGVLNVAADAHARYVLMHPDIYDQGVSVHEQVEGHQGYYGSRFWERMEAAGYGGKPFREVIAYQATPAGAVAHWMETVYHRLPIVHPSARHVGYAEAQLGKSRINVLDIGSGDGSAPHVPTGVAWPPDGATEVPLSWDGLESPTPPAPPTGYPSGPVVTLTFDLTADFEILTHRIVDLDGDRDRDLPHVFLSPENDPHLEGESSIAIYTHDPLEPGHTYEVTVSAIVDGQVFDRSWTFTTRQQAHCSPLAQDCGAGKGCYATTAGATCAWAGALDEGSACDYQNDCSAGLTCVGGACRRYCLTSGEASRCERICEAGHSLLNVGGGVGACKVPALTSL